MLCDASHPLRQGLAEEIPWLKRQTRLTFARCGIIDPRSLDDYRAHGGGKGLAQAVSLGAGCDDRSRSFNPVCADAAGPASRPVSSGGRWRRQRRGKSTSFATPMKVIAGPSPTA